MPIVGLNFDKINAEKKDLIKDKVDVKTNLQITDLKEESIPIEKSKEKVLKFTFEFTVNYEPKIGDILLKGHILYLDDQAKINSIFKEWKKSKKIETKLMQQLLNAILIKSNIKAFSLAQEVNLPPHIRLPLIKPTDNLGNYIG
jgi:hypothetical protein